MSFGRDGLFYHNPPSNQDVRKAILVGRQREQTQLRQRIPGSMDSSAVRAIHGENRVGKSLLSLVFLDELGDKYHRFMVAAAGGLTARLILQDLYEEVRLAVLSVKEPVDLQPEEVSSAPMLDGAKELILQYDGLITGSESKREITFLETDEQSDSIGFFLTLIEKIFGVTYNWAVKRQKTTGGKIELPPVTDYRLIDIIRELIGVLSIVTNKKSIVYVDDVDLLDVGPSAAQQEVVLLIRLLHRLAQSPEVTVAASLRTRHMTTAQKELSEALLVHPLNEVDIRRVYDKHIEHFNNSQSIFSEECISEIIAWSGGQIGSFLRLCNKFNDWGTQYARADENKLLDRKDLEDFVLAEAGNLARIPECRQHLKRIVEAVREGKLEVELDKDVLCTPLIYTLLEDAPYVTPPTSYYINPFVARVLRERSMESGKSAPDGDRGSIH